MFITGASEGISRVEENINGQWVKVPMNSDMGQAFILKGNSGTNEIRIFDVNGAQYYNRSYKFGFPASCPGNQCGSAPAYEVAYKTAEFLTE